jgi:hypothetical protein
MLGLSRSDSLLVLGEDAEQIGRQLEPWVQKVAYTADKPGLAFEAGSLDWIIVNGLTPGVGGFGGLLASLLPNLRPGGRVLVAFDNRWGLSGRVRAGKKSTGVSRGSLRQARALLASAGCIAFATYAVLPNRAAARTMIPLEPPCTPAAEKFALNQAWKRASPGSALGRLVLHALIDIRQLRHFYPHLLVVARRA